MAHALRPPAIRSAVSSFAVSHCHPISSPPHSQTQRRWARVHDVRFLATHHARKADAAVTERYKSKLTQKAQAEGLEGIGELKEAYRERISEVKKNAAQARGETSPSDIDISSTSPSSASPWPQPPPAPSPTSANEQQYTKPPRGVTTLSSFLDVSKTLELPAKEIEAIWRLRHANSPRSLCATIPATTFRNIAATARRHPLFVLPGLPRKTAEDAANAAEPAEGAPIHFLQWTFPHPDVATVLFTHLAEYKARGEYAQPHTTVTHHLELAGPKGLVLCQGMVVPDRGVSVDEAKWLVMNLQKFYNVGSAVEDGEASDVGRDLKRRRRELVEMFGRGDGAFRVEDVLEEAEKMG